MHDATNYDIIAIGMQEVKAPSWIEKFQTIFNAFHTTLCTITMWRMTLCVFIRKNLLRLVKNVEACEKPTGIAHIIGNKGGVMISFKVHE